MAQKEPSNTKKKRKTARDPVVKRCDGAWRPNFKEGIMYEDAVKGLQSKELFQGHGVESS